MPGRREVEWGPAGRGRGGAMAGGGRNLAVLQALDVATTQLYHFMATAIAGMGIFTDAYNIFSISLVVDLIGHLYYGGRQQRWVSAAIDGSALAGTVVGQLVFGWLGDKMGRKRIYGVTLMIMVASSLASGFSFGRCTGRSVVGVLCFFRFWLGVSIGGDYPISATIVAEYANKSRRGAFISAVFAMQGFGNLAAGIVGVITSAAFQRWPLNPDYLWRMVLMFGAVPAILTYYWRMKMPETARYTALVAMDARMAASDMSSVLNMDITPEEDAVNELAGQDRFGLFSMEFLRRHGLHLLCTAVCWFFLDVIFYTLNLFMKDIFTAAKLIGEEHYQANPVKRMMVITLVHTALALGGTLPGYFATVAFVDRVGRVKIQFIGFAMMAVLMVPLAIFYDEHHWLKPKMNIGFAFVYASTLFFANFGPNTTTFIIPVEIFPARMRSSCHGVSGAAGKIGAILGVVAFSVLNHRFKQLLYVLVGCALAGLPFTLLLPETRGRSLEEITGEMEGHAHDEEDKSEEMASMPISV